MGAIILSTVLASQFTIPDTPFASQVVAQCPKLLTATTDWERTTLLREWAWSHIDYAPSNEANTEFIEAIPNWRTLPADQLFDTFQHKRGGVICAGAAIALRALYEYFGYQAWQICNRSNGNPRHSVTVVAIVHNGSGILAIQDPSFNCRYVKASNSQPLHYYEFLTLLKSNHPELIHVDESDWTQLPAPCTIVPVKYIVQNAKKTMQIQKHVYQPTATYTTYPDGTVVIVSPRIWRDWLYRSCYEGGIRSHLKEIIDAGQPPCIHYWLAEPMTVMGPDSNGFLSESFRYSSGELSFTSN